MLTAFIIAAAVSSLHPADADECQIYRLVTQERGGYDLARALTDTPSWDWLAAGQKIVPLDTTGPAIALWSCGLPAGRLAPGQPADTSRFISRPVFNKSRDRAFVIVGDHCAGAFRWDFARDRRGIWAVQPAGPTRQAFASMAC